MSTLEEYPAHKEYNREDYDRDRKKLIESERELRFDHKAISEATEKERQAVKIVQKMREHDKKNVWNTSEDKLMYPGMEFLTAKGTILKTRLYQLIKKMPKGAVLHGHMDAMCDAEFLYSLALQHPNIHIQVPSRIILAPFPLPKFKPLSPALAAQRVNAALLTSESYTPESWVPLSAARLDPGFGGPRAFDKWIIDSMMINPKEAYVDFNTSVKIWEKFRSTFDVAGGLIYYEPILKAYMRQMIVSSIEDGISYLELRVNFFDENGTREDGSETLGHRDWLVLFQEAIDEVKENMKAEHRESEFIGAKIIYATLRFIKNDRLLWYMKDCIALKKDKDLGHLIAGFDLVAQEDTGKPLVYYIDSLLWFQAETKKEKLDIPFIFHAGETLDDGGEADSNLYDALLLGTKRIGHGFSLVKHPKLMQMCKERGVAIEVCPISNEILRLTSSMPMHPLPALLNNGVTVALCPDDPSVFGNMGLSFDFYQVIVSSEITSILSLKQLARQSLEHSSLVDTDKKQAIELWEGRWEKFIDDLVASEQLEESV